MFQEIANAATEKNPKGSLGVKNLPSPRMMKISDLLVGFHQHSADSPPKLNYILMQGCDARFVPTFKCMAGSVRQIASQFNNGESQDRELTHPKRFKYDPTQGPAEQRTAWRPALARYENREACDDMNDFLQDETFKRLFDYQFGYLTPKPGVEQECLDWLATNIDQIYLNVERVHIDDSPNTAIQVLNAGLALGIYDSKDRNPKVKVLLDEMCSIVLTAQYRAVAAVAIREARANPDKRIPVTFTLVGGGVFGNSQGAIANALKAAFDLLENSGINNLDVCLSAYRKDELDTYRRLPQLEQFFKNVTEVLTQDKLRSLENLPVSYANFNSSLVGVAGVTLGTTVGAYCAAQKNDKDMPRILEKLPVSHDSFWKRNSSLIGVAGVTLGTTVGAYCAMVLFTQVIPAAFAISSALATAGLVTAAILLIVGIVALVNHFSKSTQLDDDVACVTSNPA